MATKTRVITAVVLAPLAFALVFLLPAGVFCVAAGLLLLIGSWEFRKLADIEQNPAGWLLPALQAGIFLLLAHYWSTWSFAPVTPFLVACLAWLAMLLQLKFFRPGSTPDRTYSARSFLNSLGVLTFGWMALAWLRTEPAGEWWILVLLLIIWAADIGAYFAGRSFGRRKLAPRISPGKTRAGLYGGLIAAAIVPVVAVSIIPALDAKVSVMALMGLVTAIASVGGDLFISMHKRTVGCKDSGRLFPGHGGVLDRLDSLLAGAPFFVLGKLLAGL
jgi:phosphatidate cytidylyltransferase